MCCLLAVCVGKFSPTPLTFPSFRAPGILFFSGVSLSLFELRGEIVRAVVVVVVETSLKVSLQIVLGLKIPGRVAAAATAPSREPIVTH